MKSIPINIILQVKEIEKRDSVLTSKQQIDRLMRRGSSYFNLNPYEVLQIDPEYTVDETKKKYKRVQLFKSHHQLCIYQPYIFTSYRSSCIQTKIKIIQIGLSVHLKVIFNPFSFILYSMMSY